MKMKYTVILSLILLLAFGLFHFENVNAAGKSDTVQHIVLFSFKTDTPKETIDKVVRDAAAMPETIKEIDSMVWGSEINEVSRAQGYTHCLNMHFKNEADLKTYEAHATHQTFKSFAVQHVEKLLVFDYHPNQ